MKKTRNIYVVCLAAVILVLGIVSSSFAAINVGLVYADNLNLEVSAYLASTGLLGSVTYVDAKYSTPTLAQLNAYDSVLVWGHHGFADNVTLGNNLADYVDGGGGVVLCPFSDSANWSEAPLIKGRIAGPTYSATSPDGYIYYSSVGTMGVHDSGSPILAGVTTATGGPFRSKVIMNPGAVSVAMYADVTTLSMVATNHGGQVVNVNLYPGENTSASDMTGEYATLYANALIYSADAGNVNPVPEPSSLFGLGAGLAGLLGFIRRRVSMI